MEQIEHDATPEFLEELKSKICAGYTEECHPSVANLANLFQDKSLNPFNFPFEYLLNGTLPEEPLKGQNNVPTIQVVPVDSDDVGDSLKKKIDSKTRPAKRKRLSTPKKSINWCKSILLYELGSDE